MHQVGLCVRSCRNKEDEWWSNLDAAAGAGIEIVLGTDEALSEAASVVVIWRNILPSD